MSTHKNEVSHVQREGGAAFLKSDNAAFRRAAFRPPMYRLSRIYSLAIASLLAIGVTSAPAVDLSVPPIISHIPREPVESHGLAAVGYSKRLRALELEFRRGGTYRYLDVPATVHQELLKAESKTQYYNSAIKGKYRCLRVRPSKKGVPPR